jgi:hypothetical protein
MRRTKTQDVFRSARRITAFERRQIAVEALGMDERTVAAAYSDPTGVRESTLLRVRKAARALGLPVPTSSADAKGSQK